MKKTTYKVQKAVGNCDTLHDIVHVDVHDGVVKFHKQNPANPNGWVFFAAYSLRHIVGWSVRER